MRTTLSRSAASSSLMVHRVLSPCSLATKQRCVSWCTVAVLRMRGGCLVVHTERCSCTHTAAWCCDMQTPLTMFKARVPACQPLPSSLGAVPSSIGPSAQVQVPVKVACAMVRVASRLARFSLGVFRSSSRLYRRLFVAAIRPGSPASSVLLGFTHCWLCIATPSPCCRDAFHYPCCLGLWRVWQALAGFGRQCTFRTHAVGVAGRASGVWLAHVFRPAWRGAGS